MLAAAVAIEVALADSAEWSVNLGKVFHKSVPALSYTCPKKQDEGLWHRAEVCVIACLLTKPGEAEHLCERNCKHQEKDKPGCQQIDNRSKTSGAGLEKLVELIVPRDDQQSHRDQEELLELDESAVVEFGKQHERRDEGTRYRKKRIHVPRTPSETYPRETNNPDDDVGDVDGDTANV